MNRSADVYISERTTTDAFIDILSEILDLIWSARA